MRKSKRDEAVVNRSLTYRWMDLDAFRASLVSLRAQGGETALESGVSCGRGYLRITDAEADVDASAFAGAEELAAGCEIFELTAASPAHLERLLEELLGPGGLAGVCGVMASGMQAVLEWRGDLFVLFDFLDLVGIGAERRAVLPLLDETLVATARVLWRDPELDEARILERAAEGMRA